MRITDLDHPLNSPKEWADTEKPSFSVRKFQKQINGIVGTTDDKQPILKLMWGHDAIRWEAGYLRRQYRCFTHWIDSAPVDVGVPRWVLLERMEPARYLPGWEAARWQPDPDTGNLVDAIGPPPANGWYPHLTMITFHKGGCCARNTLGCFGLYWEPDDDVLEIVRRMKAERDALPYKTSPHEPVSADELRDAQYRARAFDEAAKARKAAVRSETIGDMWRTHGLRMITGDDNDKARAYSFDRYQPTPGGIYVPKVV